MCLAIGSSALRLVPKAISLLDCGPNARTVVICSSLLLILMHKITILFMQQQSQAQSLRSMVQVEWRLNHWQSKRKDVW